MADQLTGLATLLQTLGGTKTSTSAGDTSALTASIGQLQAADYEKLLQGIFQQAGAEIPKLQVGLANALGARSGNNSAVAAALQSLMQQTALAGQKQIADQQLQNQQLQVQAGTGVAQATKGTTVQSGTNLTRAAGILSALAGLKKAGKDFGGLGGLFGSDASSPAAPITGAAPATTYPVTGGSGTDIQTSPLPALDFSAIPGVTTSAGNTSTAADLYAVPDASVQSTTLAPLPADPTTPVSDANFGEDWLNSLIGFADGGLVGRDGHKAKLMQDDDGGETQEARLRTQNAVRYDTGFEANKLMDHLQDLVGAMTAGSTHHYDNGFTPRFADGGLVGAAGSRRSANPIVQQDTINKLQAGISATELSNPNSNVQLVDLLNAVTGNSALSSTSSSGGTSGTGAGTSIDPLVGKALSGASAIDALSGLTGGPSLAGSTGVGLGSLAGLVNARTAADVLTQFGQMAASAISPGAGAAFATGSSVANDDASRTANILASLANPALGAANLVSSLLGGQTAGSLLMGTPGTTPQGYGPVTEATPGLLGSAGVTSGGGSWHGNTAATVSPVTNYGPVTSTSLASLGSSGDSGGDSSSSSASMANGGRVKGPGTGTSDSIPARLSKGEYVIPADVVSQLGPDFFDMLNKVLHTPTGAQ